MQSSGGHSRHPRRSTCPDDTSIIRAGMIRQGRAPDAGRHPQVGPCSALAASAGPCAGLSSCEGAESDRAGSSGPASPRSSRARDWLLRRRRLARSASANRWSRALFPSAMNALPSQSRCLGRRVRSCRPADDQAAARLCNVRRHGGGKLVLPVRIELTTSALPRMRSTTELRQHDVRGGKKPSTWTRPGLWPRAPGFVKARCGPVGGFAWIFSPAIDWRGCPTRARATIRHGRRAKKAHVQQPNAHRAPRPMVAEQADICCRIINPPQPMNG